MLPFLVALVAALALAPAAQATFHEISIREVYAGSVAAPQSSYVEVQMYVGGQEQVGGKGIDLFGPTGTPIDANGVAAGTTLTFSGPLSPPGVNQQTILIGDDGVAAALGVTPDLSNAAFNVPAAGGAACWATSIDCVSWGSFSGSLPSSAGTPADAPPESGIPAGMAIRRSITGGNCTNLLDIADDTQDSASDFSNAAPAPVAYTTVPSPPACTPPASPPSASIPTKPASRTKAQNATFGFTSSPPGAEFECRIESDPFVSCNSGTASYPGPLAEGSHTFEVKAKNGNGTGSPASWTWTVDLTPPGVEIENPKPPTPNSGSSLTFKFKALNQIGETGTKFECSLAKGAALDSFANCNPTPTTGSKTYSNLSNGDYVFKVRAVDQATNVGSPQSYPFTVDTSAGDKTPPDTTIVSKPPDPSGSTTATFTYTSEPNATFACSLDNSEFVSCDAAGVTYTGLAEGSHTFRVRATDAAKNTDETPAGYSFNVVLSGPPPEPNQEVTISFKSKPKAKTHDRTPTFKFEASHAPVTFQCALDGKRATPCRSPFTTKKLSFGRHKLTVTAKLPAGFVARAPAVCSFKVVKPR